MMKRIIALILAGTLLLSLAACGGESKPAKNAAAVETSVVTEPTLSPEETLIASLPEKVRQAYDEGIVELSMLEDLDRVITTDETVALIQKIYGLHFGEESVVLNQVAGSSLTGLETTRHWLALSMYAPLAEHIYGAAPYATFEESIRWLTVEAVGDYHIDPRLIATGMMLVTENNPLFWMYDNSNNYRKEGITGYYYYSAKDYANLLGPPDLEEFYDIDWLGRVQWDEDMQNRARTEGWVQWLDYGFRWAHWTNLAGDRLTGEKILAGDLETPFGPREKMTVREAVEAALRYHHFILPDPQMLTYDYVPPYDQTIITQELLNKETTLPEASCANLPKEWKGVTMQNLIVTQHTAMPDNLIQANELDIVKAAGFNYVEILFDFKYYCSDNYDPADIEYSQVKGHMDENKLKELDRIIALCMERDIHVNLCCAGITGYDFASSVFNNSASSYVLAEQWAVLARRYRDIPNTYLSFTMFRDPSIHRNSEYGKYFTRVVEAIRVESPDRCIIANLVNYQYDLPTSMAELGVAISCNMPEPDGFFAHSYNNRKADWDTFFQEAQWPYTENGKTYSAETAMGRYYSSNATADKCAQMAREYGIGFMITNWRPVHTEYTTDFRQRYQDETVEAFLTDFYTVLEERGYGWCYGIWYGSMGIVSGYPSLDSTTYTKVEDVNLYIDEEMMNWFQILNGVK